MHSMVRNIFDNRCLNIFAVLCALFLSACAQPLDRWDLSVLKIENLPANKFSRSITVGNIKTPNSSRFEHIYEAIERSLQRNGLLYADGDGTKFILDIEVVRYELTRDDRFMNEYEANVTYLLKNERTGQIALSDEILSVYNSDMYLGGADEIKAKAGKETGDVAAGAADIAVRILLGAGAGFEMQRPSMKRIKEAEESAAGRVIRANFEAFIRKIAELYKQP